MNTEQYKALSNRLGTMEDVKRIAKEEGFDEELLLVIYTQRVTRNATKSYYRVKAKARHLLKEWDEGRPLILLARRNRFPPVLMAYLMMMEKNVGRKTFWKYVRDPDNIPNKRLRREIKEVVKKDHIYSPRGYEVQAKRGKDGEARLERMLDKMNISYLTEKDLRGQSAKTPDVLLHTPLLVDGHVVNWIESKGNFGDLVEVKRNTKKQLQPYVKLFGPGMVVYWFGWVSDAPQDDDILIVDGEYMDDVFRKESWGSRLRSRDGADSPTENLRAGPGGASDGRRASDEGVGGMGEDLAEAGTPGGGVEGGRGDGQAPQEQKDGQSKKKRRRGRRGRGRGRRRGSRGRRRGRRGGGRSSGGSGGGTGGSGGGSGGGGGGQAPL